MVAQMTLDHLVKVRILVPQFNMSPATGRNPDEFGQIVSNVDDRGESDEKGVFGVGTDSGLWF